MYLRMPLDGACTFHAYSLPAHKFMALVNMLYQFRMQLESCRFKERKEEVMPSKQVPFYQGRKTLPRNSCSTLPLGLLSQNGAAWPSFTSGKARKVESRIFMMNSDQSKSSWSCMHYTTNRIRVLVTKKKGGWVLEKALKRSSSCSLKF